MIAIVHQIHVIASGTLESACLHRIRIGIRARRRNILLRDDLSIRIQYAQHIPVRMLYGIPIHRDAVFKRLNGLRFRLGCVQLGQRHHLNVCGNGAHSADLRRNLARSSLAESIRNARLSVRQLRFHESFSIGIQRSRSRLNRRRNLQFHRLAGPNLFFACLNRRAYHMQRFDRRFLAFRASVRGNGIQLIVADFCERVPNRCLASRELGFQNHGIVEINLRRIRRFTRHIDPNLAIHRYGVFVRRRLLHAFARYARRRRGRRIRRIQLLGIWNSMGDGVLLHIRHSIHIPNTNQECRIRRILKRIICNLFNAVIKSNQLQFRIVAESLRADFLHGRR